MTRIPHFGAMTLVCLAGGAFLAGLAHLPGAHVLAADKPTVVATGWSPAAAARYLDSRETWWQGWDRAHKDHGTLCVSCHTQATYGLARPVLRRRLGEPGMAPQARGVGEQAMPPQEQAMLASIEKRVRGWKEMQPFYSDAVYGTGKEIESRNAE